MGTRHLDRYLDTRWAGLLEAVKAWVNAGDARVMEELCRDTWESYAHLRWVNSPLAGRYEIDLVDPACVGACETLSEFEITVLLAWRWDEYLNGNDPGVDFPGRMSLDARRRAVVEVLREAVYVEAASDGAAVEERNRFSEEAEED